MSPNHEKNNQKKKKTVGDFLYYYFILFGVFNYALFGFAITTIFLFLAT